MSTDKSRLNELQGALRDKMTATQEIADSFKVEDGTVIIESEKKEAFDKNMRDIKEIKSLIQSMQEMDQVREWGEQPTETSVAVEAGATPPNPLLIARKSLGEAFIESPQFQALHGGRAGATMAQPFEVKSLHDYHVKDVYSSMPTGTPSYFGATQRDEMVTLPQLKKRVRDLFPARSTNAAVIEYFKVTGFTNNASVVPERASGAFAAKPQSTLTFVGEQTPVRTIAHWEAAHRNVLADEPQLRGIIDNELLYGLKLHEDYQILNGTGTGEDLAGILSNSDIQSYSWSEGASVPVDDTMADAIRRAATLAFLAYYEPTGVVLHPSDWEKIELTKNTQGTYLMAISMQQGSEQRIWRLPVIDTPAMTEGTALLGAFGTGAQLYDREAATIRVAEQHSDFFIRNAIVILAEERLAMAVKRPEAFVKITFDAAP
jgi:HK97 family phage major capsid protein